MTDEQLKKSNPHILHVPTALGAVVLTYNLGDEKAALKLDGSMVADIFLGKIKNWNDARIAKLNPGAKLPNSDILIAHRADGSGTTNIFTDYLSQVSSEWKEKVGVGTSVNWPVGLGGKGNEGVAGLVKQTPGAIGFVELIYAENNHLPFATLKNKSGEFAKPSVDSVTAAAAGALQKIPKDFRVSIVNADGKAAYPISGFTYLLVYEKMPRASGESIVKFIRWALKDGQKMTTPLEFAPLPKALVQKVLASLDGIHYD